MTIGDTIRQIDDCSSWAVLKNVEQNPAYESLLRQLLSELGDPIEMKTGPMLKQEAYIFISSPGAVTPFHFDPEHNILLQVRGTKEFHIFPRGAERYAPQIEHERYHHGGHRNLPWKDAFEDEGAKHTLGSGDALYVPVMAPHYVRNGDRPSVSLSITWRSTASMEEARVHAFNHWLRKHGFEPDAPASYPQRNGLKSTAYRIGKRLKVVS